MNDLRNPYIAGAPVVESSMFFGREDVFKWIENSLTGKYVDHILVLHGQRRVGKTTVLKQIPNFLPDQYIQVFFDLQGRTNTTLDRFLWWMASEIIRTLNKALNADLPRIKRDQFSEPDTFITEFIPSLKLVLDGHVLLLTFDEFDTLAREDIQDQLARPLISFFRRLFEIDGLNFIFSIGSSGNKLENMQAAYTNFFKTALYRKVSFLTKDDCVNLITKPVAGVITYHPKAVQRIIEITSGHPYFTQLTCHELFSRCQSSEERKVNVADVEGILDDVIERGTVNLKFVWDEATDLEKWILAVLATEEGLSQIKIGEVLQSHGVRFSAPDLNAAILHLRDKDVLTPNNRLVIHLMKLWLERNRPMDRVREELVQTNPIADRYLEIGDEYRDRGQLEQALSSYQQALSVQANNINALFNMGSIYLEQENYQQAASAFEKALQVDDEHIAARQGFCEAHLALGNQAQMMGSTSEAIESYQIILNLTPVHAEARKRLAEIYRGQAEGMLAAGSDQQALEQFRLAMEMTPEDEKLSARYAEIIAKKKAALVKSWLDKAERSIRRQRWDEATKMAEEALKVDPDDKLLQARVAKIKDAPRQEKLKIYRADAETAIVKGDYPKAIESIKTAILLAPDDAELQEWLATTQGSQQNARLRLYQSQAKKAQDEGDWEAAVTARQAALKLDPGNNTLLKALEETRAAQHQAKLDALQSQVATARQGGRWEEAIRAAQDLLTLVPEDESVKRDLEDLRAAQRQARLENLLKDADAAAGQERWKDAVTAWEAYLEEVPSDREKYEVRLEKARQYARLSANYEDAQAMIKKGHYHKAIPLLQGIIAQDPTYKSTSRLLVEAVEARGQRKPFRISPWVFAGISVVLLVVMGFVFSDRITAMFTPSPEASQVGEVENPGENQSPDVVTEPEIGMEETLTEPAGSGPAENDDQEETPTPKTIWMAEIIEPIQNYVDSEPPTFEDDFSTQNSVWGNMQVYEEDTESPTQTLIAEGQLSLRTLTAATIPLSAPTPLAAKNFVLEFDMTHQSLNLGAGVGSVFMPDGTCLGIRFRSSEINTYGDFSSYDFCYNHNYHSWNVRKFNISPSAIIDFNDFDSDDFRLRLIAYGDVFAIFADGELLTVFQDDEFTGIDNFILVNDAFIVLDNLKFWNLDQVDADDIEGLYGSTTEETQTEPTPTKTTQATPEPEPWVTNFVEPILGYIAERAPDVEDDFSNESGNWEELRGNVDTYVVIVNGELKTNVGAYKNITFYDYVVEVDVKPYGSNYVGFELSNGSAGFVRFGVNKNARWELSDPVKKGGLIGSVAPYHLQVIIKGAQMAFLINGKPIEFIEYEDWRLYRGYPPYIALHVHIPPAAYFDNFKVWNITRFDLPSD